ncbi:nodulation protein NodT [Jannaschia sp. AI_61]|uniref:efflux transporter outer membrane subunit n=1 Tax=Jannaschia sp. AI_61 TaxID=2829796 RepID=UPI001BC141A8|nr:efflux transporter outer membrane subunit [Jannaschia sp. AI_61]GIT93280.1 nodulation protein NodT [Jannaschia sp. AI_61]
MAFAMAVTGCVDVTVPYTSPIFPFLPGYGKADAGAPVLLKNSTWWQGLGDHTLNRVVAHGLRGNIDLAVARERVVAAQAARRGIPGATLISSSVGAQLEGNDTSAPEGTATGTTGLTWLLDPWGGRRNQIRAAEARVEVARAETDAARLLLLGTLTETYARLRHSQRSLTQNEAELRRRQSTLALTRTLVAAEAATRLEVVRSRARVAEIRAQLPALRAQITAERNALAVLLGRAPHTLPADLATALTQPGPQPRPSLSPEVGIPADLLRNRPDIRIAERSYYASVADIGVARADLYPRLSLGGTITLNALSNTREGVEYAFGPTVQFPNLPLTQARETVKASHSAARQAHGIWVSTVLTALLDVENALVEYDATTTAMGAAQEAHRLHREALGLMQEVFKAGEATLGDLIDAEEAVLSAERILTDLRLEQALRFVTLNVSLGAGNTAEPDTVVAAK